MSEAPATSATETNTSTDEASEKDTATQSAATSVDPTSASRDDDKPLTSVDDFGDGPDGDPQPGETREQQLKRIGRREKKERLAAEKLRDEASTRATDLETQLTEAKAAAEKLTEAEQKVSSLESDLSTAQLALFKYEVGGKAGLTMAQSKRLMGATKEELEADTRQYIADNGIPGGDGGNRQTVPDDAAARAEFVARMRARR